MRRVFLIVLVCFCAHPVLAQHHGSIELGGSFSFRNVSNSEQSARNLLNLNALFGFYLNRDIIIQLEPGIDLAFDSDQTDISSLILIGGAMRLFDLAPSYGDKRQWEKRMASAASVYMYMSPGFWSESISAPSEESTTYQGAALSIGIGSHTLFSRYALLRTSARLIYLFPSGDVYDVTRTIFQVSIGVGVFIR